VFVFNIISNIITSDDISCSNEKCYAIKKKANLSNESNTSSFTPERQNHNEKIDSDEEEDEAKKGEDPKNLTNPKNLTKDEIEDQIKISQLESTLKLGEIVFIRDRVFIRDSKYNNTVSEEINAQKKKGTQIENVRCTIEEINIIKVQNVLQRWVPVRRYNLKTIDIKDDKNNLITFNNVEEEYIVRPESKLIVRLYHSDNDYTTTKTISTLFRGESNTEVLFYDYCELHDHGFNNDDDKYENPTKNENYPLGGGSHMDDLYEDDVNKFTTRISESLGLSLPNDDGTKNQCVDLVNAQMYNIYFRGKKYYSPSNKIRDKDGNFIASGRVFEKLEFKTLKVPYQK
jgi:hypothetical protein